MEKEQLNLLQGFVQVCQANPDVLHTPELAFYRKFLESLGAKIPERSHANTGASCGGGCPHEHGEPKKTFSPPPAHEPEPEVEDSPESDVDIDNEGVVDPDHDEAQPMGDDTIEPTDEMLEVSGNKRDEAVAAVGEGNLELAIQCYTESIKNNPQSANLYAKRASIFIRMQKPNAAIRDCNKAIELNPDSAQPYKWRGKAYRLLGQWEEAFRDLSKSCQLDYDDDTNEARREVEPRAKKLLEHKRRQERKREEKELASRRERVRKAKEENEKARKEQEAREASGGFSGGFPGGFGRGGGFPGGFHGGGFPGAGAGFPGAGMPGMPDLSALLQDPELLQAFQDPEVAAAFQDISTNPANISKYQNNPKIQKLIKKMSNKFQGPDVGDADMDDVSGSSMPGSGTSSGHTVPPQPDID